MKTIDITGEYIGLGQLLKFAGFVGSGGEGRELLEAGKVFVNGATEGRRGRKVRHGDVVAVRGREPVCVEAPIVRRLDRAD
ncbi:MAG: RNA-binding S4 domain-containing protein [Armatimonadetes bacterium]|nr:RNA-binding S4 domain-containing protein [Armatimonadota bacterium]